MADVLYSWATESPLATAALTLAFGWGVANYCVRGPSALRTGSASAAEREESVRKARERQQQQLLAAAEARAGTAAQAKAPPAAPAPEPESESEPVMPARMQASLKRKAAAEAAATRAAAGEAAAPAVPAPTAPAPTAPAPKAPAPQAEPKKRTTANDPNSITQRLARLEKGKGPSEHNPLHGHGSGSSAGSAFQCTKKGG